MVQPNGPYESHFHVPLFKISGICIRTSMNSQDIELEVLSIPTRKLANDSLVNTQYYQYDSQISKRLTCHTTSDINCISDENLISDLERPLTVPSDQQPERNIDNQLLSQQNNLSFQPDKNNSSSLIKRISLSLPNTNSVE
ncbi:hypothetical protein KEM48_001059 [Puccinia striiformis f. sp. tritici PST-130]|nr:hypothetical protein KEM48_001059 [Puccinia striiformis f. sp. tritici PST-130]